MMSATAVALVALASLTPQQNNNYPDWLKDTGKAFRESRRTGKPLFITFR